MSWSIVALNTEEEARTCARMMTCSEPWITLGRTYEASLEIIRDPTREVHLLRDENAIRGFVILCMTGAFVGYIQTICIDPHRRGQGLGSRLLEFAEGRILGQVPNVFMCVSSFNHGARRLYERLGYRIVGELTDYIVRGHSEILLRKSIGPLTAGKQGSGTAGQFSQAERGRTANHGDGARGGEKLGSKMREARLRPEFADMYPTLTPGQWEPAARVAEVVLARLLLLELGEAPLHDRILDEKHFEFRGETPDGTPRRDPGSRAADSVKE